MAPGPVVVRSVSSSAPRLGVGAPAAVAAPVVAPRRSRATQHLRDSKPVRLSAIERDLAPARGAVIGVRRDQKPRANSRPLAAPIARRSSLPALAPMARFSREGRKEPKAAVAASPTPLPSPARSLLPLHVAKPNKAHSDNSKPRKDDKSVCKERPRDHTPSVGRAGRSRPFIPWCS